MRYFHCPSINSLPHETLSDLKLIRGLMVAVADDGRMWHKLFVKSVDGFNASVILKHEWEGEQNQCVYKSIYTESFRHSVQMSS